MFANVRADTEEFMNSTYPEMQANFKRYFGNCEFSWRVIKGERGGTDECKKAGKGGKGHENAIFNGD